MMTLGRFGKNKGKPIVEGNGASCSGQIIWEMGTSNNTIAAFEERVVRNARYGLKTKDEHWVPQTNILKRCGWDKFAPEKLDYIGNLSGDVHSQVLAMLHIANVSEASALAARFFPQGRKAGHSSSSIDSALFYRNKTVAQ